MDWSNLERRLCPNCNCEVLVPVGKKHCMSDAEWDEYIDNLILPDKEKSVDALEAWLS